MQSFYKPAINLCLFMLLFNFSCRKSAEDTASIKTALKAAGKNGSELLLVLKHYHLSDADSLKLKAAIFLMNNMAGCFHYEGQSLDRYSEYLKLIRSDQAHGQYYMDAFKTLYGSFSYRQLKKVNDLETVASENIIENVDMAFQVWQEAPWKEEVSFKDFCDYILPFKIEDEAPEYNRKSFYDLFQPFINGAKKNKLTLKEAAVIINNQLKYPNWILTQKVGFLPHFKSSQLLKYKVGSCRDMADLAIFAMRSVGIPVANDFLPQWPYRSMGHNWNALILRNGRSVMFLGAEDDPGIAHKPDTKKGKVFRYRFSKPPLPANMIGAEDEYIPPLFTDSRLVDVTTEYVKAFDVGISLLNAPYEPRNLAYLAVYNDRDWIPVHWAAVNDGKAFFSKMEGGIVYLPVFAYETGVQAFNYPFLLNSTGNVKYLKPDWDRKHELVLNRYYPVIPDQFWVQNLIGGVFQASNNPDFKDVVMLDSLKDKPHPFWNEITINENRPFRYVRFLSSSGGHCNIGELNFYSRGKKIDGQIIGTRGAFGHSNRDIHKAMDGDMLTFFDAPKSSGGWVGLDLGEKKRISRIVFSAATEQKEGALIDGHKYQLFVWENGQQWILAGTARCYDGKARFKNMPEHALFKLQDTALDNDSRIFCYEKGRVEWY